MVDDMCASARLAEERAVELRAQQAILRDSEAKFRTMFTSLSDALILQDETGFLDCNQAALHMFGCSTVDELPAPVHSPRFRRPYSRAARTRC